MLNKNDLANLIVDNMLSGKPENVNDAQTIMGDTLNEYITDNIEIKFSWVGIMPPNVPDPTTSYDAKIKFLSFKILPPPDLTTYGIMLGTIIATGIVTPDDTTFSVSPITLLPTPILLTFSHADDQSNAMLHFADEVIKGIKNKINPVPIVGSHNVPPLTYTGTGIMINIL